MQRKISAVLVLLLVSISFVTAEMVSEKKEIAVFRLSYYNWPITDGTLGDIDEQIKSVFINLGRFDVIGMTYRLEQGDVQGFIRQIQSYKESQVELSESVLLGRETFTEADLNKLIGSFIVVIPSVSSYQTEADDDGNIIIKMETSFTFINVEQMKTIGQFFIKTSGKNEDIGKAIKSAVDSIASQLDFQIRKMEEFKLKTGVLEVRGGSVLIELGSNMGIQLGEEFEILDPRTTASGRQYTAVIGLIQVTKVDSDSSDARIVFTDRSLVPGDQLKEVPRSGSDGDLYTHVNLDLSLFDFAIRAVPTRGVGSVRPVIALGVLLSPIMDGIAAYTGLGVEYALTLGRLQISPMAYAAAALGVSFTETDSTTLSHVGGAALLSVSWLFDRDIKFYGEAGYDVWFSMDSNYPSFNGIFAGAGVTLKL